MHTIYARAHQFVSHRKTKVTREAIKCLEAIPRWETSNLRNVIVGRKALHDFKRGWDEGLAKYRCFDGLAVNVFRKPARLARICTRL